ncbi:MAG TPA: serine/threonine-protein kinase [Kofleriaceae bacterium]
MELDAGTRLGPYAIQRKIGAGGMGVVYRADDSRLGRSVAIKVLPESLHGDDDRLRRFEREARTIGGLNHPNLLTLHDVGDHAGARFLVTELLEGESVRARLVKEPIAQRDAIRIAADVARGLAAAHEAGVIHRDIKPDNIFLTDDGRTKILDFGIAKLRSGDTSLANAATDVAMAATAATAATGFGVVVGTPGYMAPEQLNGEEVDARTDLFALGVVLYEMLARRRPFAAASPIEESYAVVKVTPEPPENIGANLARVVMRCLEKKPERRFQSAADLAFALDALDGTDSAAKTRPPRRRAKLPWRWIAVAAAAGLGIAIGALAFRSPAATRWPGLVAGGPQYRRVTFHSQPEFFARLHDNSVYFTMKRGGKAEIVRSDIAVPSILPTNLPGKLADISAKGELATIVNDPGLPSGRLMRAIPGMGPRTVAEQVLAATWLDDDRLAIVRQEQHELVIELPAGTPIKRVTTYLRYLRASPDGKLLAFVESPGYMETGGRVVVIDTRGIARYASKPQLGVEGLAWSKTGELWFSSDRTIYALDRSGNERLVLRGHGQLVLVDVDGDRILVAPTDRRVKLFAGPRYTTNVSDLSWFESSIPGTITETNLLAFWEGQHPTPKGYPWFVRKVPSDHRAAPEPATALGEYQNLALLPDGGSAIVLVAADQPLQRLKLKDTVDATQLPMGPIKSFDQTARIVLSPTGTFALVRAAAADGAMRLWRYSLASPPTPPQLVPGSSPAQANTTPISPDGAWIALGLASGGIELMSATGAPSRKFPGKRGEEPLGFTEDGLRLFVWMRDGTGAVNYVDLADPAATRVPWHELASDHPVIETVVSSNGNWIAHARMFDSSDLYVLEPPRAP